MTHAEITEAVLDWLESDNRNEVILSEVMRCFKGESPDAIAFRNNGDSYLFECKTSACGVSLDKETKPFRLKDNLGMGKYRYYALTETEASGVELPDGWGLMCVSNMGVRIIKKAKEKPVNEAAERQMLLLAIRRLKIKFLHRTMRRKPLLIIPKFTKPEKAVYFDPLTPEISSKYSNAGALLAKRIAAKGTTEKQRTARRKNAAKARKSIGRKDAK